MENKTPPMKRLAVVLSPQAASHFGVCDQGDTIVFWEDEGSWSVQFYGLRMTYTGKNSDRNKGDTQTIVWQSIVFFEETSMSRWSHDG